MFLICVLIDGRFGESGASECSCCLSLVSWASSGVSRCCSCATSKPILPLAAAARTVRYEVANAWAHADAPRGDDAEQLTSSTVVLAGTVTEVCRMSSARGSLLCRALAAGADTRLDWAICASLSMLMTAPGVRLPWSWFVLAALAVT